MRWVCGASFLVLVTRTAASVPPPSEYDVKAALLYNFSKFVEWPARTFSGPDEPIKVCIVGSSPIGVRIREAVKGKRANGREFIVVDAATVSEALLCHIDFIAFAELQRRDEAIRSVGGRPVLTIGDATAFAERGGIIGLTREENRVRFEVNVVAARRAGLKLSSQLLKVATRIIEEPGTKPQ
jgi:hypothetical protein